MSIGLVAIAAATTTAVALDGGVLASVGVCGSGREALASVANFYLDAIPSFAPTILEAFHFTLVPNACVTR